MLWRVRQMNDEVWIFANGPVSDRSSTVPARDEWLSMDKKLQALQSWLKPTLGTLFLAVFHIVLTGQTWAGRGLDRVFQQIRSRRSMHYMIGKSKDCMKILSWKHAGWIYGSCITSSDGWQMLNRSSAFDEFSTDKCTCFPESDRKVTQQVHQVMHIRIIKFK